MKERNGGPAERKLTGTFCKYNRRDEYPEKVLTG